MDNNEDQIKEFFKEMPKMSNLFNNSPQNNRQVSCLFIINIDSLLTNKYLIEMA